LGDLTRDCCAEDYTWTTTVGWEAVDVCLFSYSVPADDCQRGNSIHDHYALQTTSGFIHAASICRRQFAAGKHFLGLVPQHY
jgi:hypothetical protein